MLEILYPIYVIRVVSKTNRISTSKEPPEQKYTELLAEVVSQKSIPFSKAFADFLEKEYALENLLFIQAVHSFKVSFGSKTMQTIAKMRVTIINEFINDGSVNEVNIPGSVRAAILHSVQLSPQIFDDASSIVEVMLCQSSMRRFCESDDFTNAIFL
jgi:hypothetical protein